VSRIRTIKPQFFTSEQVADCSVAARLAFIGMWCFCDDYGIHPASPARLKMEVFPADGIGREEVAGLVDELKRAGLIEEYEIEGARYWRVTGWDKHQKIDSKTGLYPLPSGEVGQKIRRTFAERSPNDHRTIYERSCKEKEKEKDKDKDKDIHTSVDASASTSERVEYSPEFDEFWAQYPRHIDKKRAYKAWCARLKAGYSPAAMIQAATNYAAHCKSNSTEERFIKHPATFIGPELSFMDEPWQKPITSKPKDDLDPPDEDENARIKNWMIERMTPEQRKQYDKVMSRAQKDYYDRLNRRPTDAHVA